MLQSQAALAIDRKKRNLTPSLAPVTPQAFHLNLCASCRRWIIAGSPETKGQT
jgi:hypothetical protein